MTQDEYIDLFHRAEVNLVAFKPVFHCDDELQKMVEMAIEKEREACAKLCDDLVSDENTIEYASGAYRCSVRIRERSKHD